MGPKYQIGGGHTGSEIGYANKFDMIAIGADMVKKCFLGSTSVHVMHKTKIRSKL